MVKFSCFEIIAIEDEDFNQGILSLEVVVVPALALGGGDGWEEEDSQQQQIRFK